MGMFLLSLFPKKSVLAAYQVRIRRVLYSKYKRSTRYNSSQSPVVNIIILLPNGIVFFMLKQIFFNSNTNTLARIQPVGIYYTQSIVEIDCHIGNVFSSKF
ncbi:UNVERIFIED_CONTAM: hypothetical protein K2H54_030789 [Gekko kuhli]